MSTLQQGYIWVSGLGDICFSKWIAELWGTTGDEEGERGPAPANKLIEQKWSSIPIKHLELNSNPTHRVDLKTLKTITFFLFLRDLHGLKGSTGRRRATECRRMMNSQTGIKFHDWDSWAVMAADQRSATPPSWSSSSQWLRSPSSPQVHCAKVKSFMNVIYSYTLATEIHRIYTESLQQQTALCQYQPNSSPLCDRSSPGRPLVSMATVFSSNGLLTSALGVCRFIWMLL